MKSIWQDLFCWLFLICSIFSFSLFTQSVQIPAGLFPFHFWIGITPLIILLLGDLAGLQFLCLLIPCVEHIPHTMVGHSCVLVQPEAEFAVQFSDFQTTGIFQCKESVHKSNICVNIRNIQSVWRYFKDLCQCV